MTPDLKHQQQQQLPHAPRSMPPNKAQEMVDRATPLPIEAVTATTQVRARFACSY